MHFSTALMIILFLITISPCILWPVSKEDIPEVLDLKKLFAATDDTFNTTSLDSGATKRSNQRDHSFSRNTKRSEDGIHTSESILHDRNLREKQMTKQFDQNYLLNNQVETSDFSRLLLQQLLGNNFDPRPSKSGSKSLSFSPRTGSHGNTLPSQETAQLDPIYIFNKPPETAYNLPVEKIEPNEEATRPVQPFGNNFFIDLLHNQKPVITGPNNDLSIFRQKLPAGSIFYSYLAGFASSIRKTSSMKENDCFLIVKSLPLLLINAFINALNTISKLKLPESLMMPFVALNVLNFIVSFLFLNEYCSHDGSS